MKTLSEVERWCQTAAERFGDPSLPVCQLFVKYVEGDSRPKSFDEYLQLFCFQDAGEFVLWLGPDRSVSISITANGPLANAVGELEDFGADQIAHGLWALRPSLNIPGLIHAFITLYGVPEPAPWAKLIVLAS